MPQVNNNNNNSNKNKKNNTTVAIAAATATARFGRRKTNEQREQPYNEDEGGQMTKWQIRKQRRSINK